MQPRVRLREMDIAFLKVAMAGENPSTGELKVARIVARHLAQRAPGSEWGVSAPRAQNCSRRVGGADS